MLITLLLIQILTASLDYSSKPIDLVYPRNSIMSFDPATGDLYLFDNLEQMLLIKRINEGQVDTIKFDVPDYDRFRAGTVINNKLRFWDRGVGRVFELDITDGSFHRIDNSFNHRNQYGHSYTYGRDGSIYAIGGYGFWIEKNLFVRFDEISRQWKEIESKNQDLVSPGRNGILFETDDKMYYLLNVMENGTYKTNMYKFNKLSAEWSVDRQKSYLFRDFASTGINHQIVQSYDQSIDHENNLIAINYLDNTNRKILLLDYKENIIYRLDPIVFNMTFLISMYYSTINKNWVLIGRSLDLTTESNLMYVTADLSSHLDLFEVYKAHFWLVYPYRTASIVFILLILLIVITHKILKDRVHKISPLLKKEKSVKIVLHENEIKEIYLQSKKVDLHSDQILLKAWNIITQNKLNNRDISVTEFDEQVFGTESDASARYRKRKKLFEMINSELDENLISVHDNNFDKRQKIIKLNTELIELSENGSKDLVK